MSPKWSIFSTVARFEAQKFKNLAPKFENSQKMAPKFQKNNFFRPKSKKSEFGYEPKMAHISHCVICRARFSL